MSFYNSKWWKEAVGYQIYIKSFKDSNDDGIGDINGITLKLDYLKNLNVDILWICPFYESPMVDNGYDVSDFSKIDKRFGTIDDFKNLINEANKRNIKIIIDLILNHTSDKHKWFINSRKDKTNEYRNFYIWEKGKNTENGLIEPTNWASFFGGSVWEYDEKTNEYYMKIFSKHMPDLNWDNIEVRKKMHEVAKFWLSLGVFGFRVDAAAHLGRNKKIKDSYINKDDIYQKDYRKFSNLNSTFKYLNEFNKEVFSNNDILIVGEVGGKATIKEAIKYSGLKKGSLNMVFNFDHCFCNNVYEIKDKKDKIKVNLKDLKNTFNKWHKKTYKKAWQPLYWLNHDHPRLLSHYGDESKMFLSSSMLAISLYFKGGTPFVYQGEELGMSNYPFKDISDFNDVSFINQYNIESKKDGFNKENYIYIEGLKSRDNSRTVMSWDSSKYAGFSNVKPWFHLDKNHKENNAKAFLKNKDSLYYFYKKIFSLRKDNKYLKTLVYGSYKQILKKEEDVYCYIRKLDKEIIVIANFFNKEKEINIKNYKVLDVLISNYKDVSLNLTNLKLRPYEALVYLVEKRK